MNQDLQERTEESALAEVAAEKKPAKKVALLKEATASRAKLDQDLQHRTMLASMNQDLQHNTMLSSMNQDLQHRTMLASMNQDLQERTEESALAEAAAEKKPAKKVALLKDAESLRAGAPAGGPAGAPGDAPAAPETQADVVRKLKGEAYKKVQNGHDSDLVVDRGTTAPPSGEKPAAVQPGTYGDIANDDGSEGAPPAPAEPGMPKKIADISADSQHKDKSTVQEDWRSEYGAAGPSGTHSAFQSRRYVGYPKERGFVLGGGALRFAAPTFGAIAVALLALACGG